MSLKRKYKFLPERIDDDMTQCESQESLDMSDSQRWDSMAVNLCDKETTTERETQTNSSGLSSSSTQTNITAIDKEKITLSNNAFGALVGHELGWINGISDQNYVKEELINVQFVDRDIDNLNKIKDQIKKLKGDNILKPKETFSDSALTKDELKTSTSTDESEGTGESGSATDITSTISEDPPEKQGPYLTTADINWLFTYLEKRKKHDKHAPYLYELFEENYIEMPRNDVLKRNPALEARCVKLRAQQEAREYRKMTKGVDNVRMRFPDDSISYQLKQVNRQLIAIGQFIISIFAGFLFGFKGVEWMIGNLEFGFRLLLGVMCALIIALAEIYFLAKKLNEELNVPETVQLGGPPKFVDTKKYVFEPKTAVAQDKEHQD